MENIRIRIDLTPKQLEAVNNLVGQHVSTGGLDRGHPLYEAERELDSALLRYEQTTDALRRD